MVSDPIQILLLLCHRLISMRSTSGFLPEVLGTALRRRVIPTSALLDPGHRPDLHQLKGGSSFGMKTRSRRRYDSDRHLA